MNRRTVTALTLLLGAALIAAGVFTGQPSDVLTKAVRICMECVGIG